MARVTVEDCLERVNSKFELATIAAKRARQLARGANARLDWEDDKPTVLALREIAAGEVTIEILDEPELPPIAVASDTPQPAGPTDEELEAEGEKRPAAAADAEEEAKPKSGGESAEPSSE